MGMMNQYKWKQRIDDAYERIADNIPEEKSQGYKLLYCKWDFIGKANYAFLTQNPSPALREDKSNDDELKKMLFDYRGNSFKIEFGYSNTHLNKQFLLLMDLIGADQDRVLTGVANPFRSESWSKLHKDFKSEGLKIGKEFWQEALNQQAENPHTIIASGSQAQKFACSLFPNAYLKSEIESGWKGIKLRKYRIDNERQIIGLPYLGYYKILGKDKYLPALRNIFDL